MSLLRGLALRLFRVDPRLVHATITNVWVPTTSARILLIGDAELERNSKKRAILEMSAMGVVDVRFRAEETLQSELDKIDKGVPLIVLFSDLGGALRAVESGLKLDRLNLGHVPEGPGREEIHPAVHLGGDDFRIIDQLHARGVEVFIQPLPQDKATVIPPRRRSEPPGPARPQIPGMVQAKLRVVNDRGLHLRAAHSLAHLAGKLPCKVSVTLEGNEVNAKSLLGLTTLGATLGTLLDVRCEGADAEKAMDEIRSLFASGFDEGRDWVSDGLEEDHP